MNNLNSKKFILALVTLLIGLGLVIFDKLSGEWYMVQLISIFSVYGGFNLADAVASNAAKATANTSVQTTTTTNKPTQDAPLENIS